MAVRLDERNPPHPNHQCLAATPGTRSSYKHECLTKELVDERFRGFPHQDRVRGVDGDLVVRGVTAGQAEVEVLDLEVHVRQDELRLDVVPVREVIRKHHRA